MDIFDQKQVLKSLSIICDTREQDTERSRKRYTSFGVPYERAALNYGDYTYNAILPNGEKIFKEGEQIFPLCSIERKMDLNELSNCFTQSRDRFEREFQRASEHGARIYLIVEDGSWEHLINGKYKTKYNSAAFTASVTAWMVRYNLGLIFCKAESSGKIIKEILYRDLKERLERGEFDGMDKT